MKTLKNLIIIFIVLKILVSLVVSKSKKSHKSHKSHKSYKSHHTNKNFPTPKALDLQNHFGLPEVGSPYGVETSMAENVERNPEVYTPQRFNKWKDVEREFTKFHPFAGWEDKLNPHHIKSGEFKNVAPAASKLVNPEITGPKLHVQAEVIYPAHTKLPTFYGYRKTLQPVTAYDKLERKIINDHVVINKPLYGWEDQVRIEYN